MALLAPSADEILGPANHRMTIRWEGHDPDGNPLTYTLFCSSDDGGRTLLPVGTLFGPETTSYVWNTTLATSSTKQGLIRIEASDGFSVPATFSELFAIALACDVNEDGSISIR